MRLTVLSVLLLSYAVLGNGFFARRPTLHRPHHVSSALHESKAMIGIDNRHVANDDKMWLTFKKCMATFTASIALCSSNLVVVPDSAVAAPGGWFPSAEQRAVNELSSFQRPINEILEQLSPMMIPNAIGVYSNTQMLKGSKDDANVVATYMETYIKPCQKEMETLAKQLPLTKEDQEKATTYSQLMKGHILELQEAIKGLKAEDQRKEVEEVQETLADYLKLLSAKYEVEPYVPPRPLTDKELFGPLGCEFWGKQRVPGSNACTPKLDN